MILTSAVLCLSLAIYFEARGEPQEGQQAIAQVIINRADASNTSYCAEVFKKGQFSWTKRPYKIPKETDPSWKQAKQIAKVSLMKKQSSKQLKSTFFKNRRSKIILARRLVVERIIGQHIFYFQRPQIVFSK